MVSGGETSHGDAVGSLWATIHAIDAAAAALERQRSLVVEGLRQLERAGGPAQYVRANPDAPRMNAPVPEVELEPADVKRLLRAAGAGALVRLAQRRGLASKLVRETVLAALAAEGR